METLRPKMPLVSAVTIAIAVVLATVRHPVIAAPNRVVSINLCADQLLLALADPGQIAGLGQLARRKNMSYLADKAMAYPSVRGSAEDLLAVKTDLVLLGSFDRQLARQMLMRRGLPFLRLDPWKSIRDGRLQIERLAARLDRPVQGKRLIQQLDQAMQTLARINLPPGDRPTFLILQRRGYVLQAGILPELLALAGLRNLAAQLSLATSGVASLEEIVYLRPDFIVVESSSLQPRDQGEAKMVHPALIRLYPPSRRLAVPDRLAICAGPSTPSLIRHLYNEITDKIR